MDAEVCMFLSPESSLLLIFAAVQICGLLSLIAARMTGGCAWHRFFCGTYLCSLLAVGLTTMLAIGCHSGWWVSCAATLALMSVGGTMDLGRGRLANYAT
jgi:hypothetical protein